MKKVLFSSVLVLMSFIVLGQDFEVSPAKIFFTLEPGESGTKQLTITNHSATPETFSISMGDFVRDSLGRKKYSPANSSDKSATSMMTLNPSTLTINPNETRTIKVSMDVPSNEYGSKWAILFVKGIQEKGAAAGEKKLSSGLMVKTQIAIHVYQSPPSNNKYKAIIRNLHEGPKDVATGARVLFATIENVGDKFLDCKINLRISNMDDASEIKLKPVKIPVLPGGIRRVELKLPTNLSPGTYSVAAIMDYGNRSNLEGVMTEVTIK